MKKEKYVLISILLSHNAIKSNVVRRTKFERKTYKCYESCKKNVLFKMELKYVMEATDQTNGFTKTIPFFLILDMML